MSVKTNGYKPILVNPEIHRRLADIGKKRETFNEIIADLIELRNQNAIVQTNPQVERPERSVLPSTNRKRDPSPNG